MKVVMRKNTTCRSRMNWVGMGITVLLTSLAASPSYAGTRSYGDQRDCLYSGVYELGIKTGSNIMNRVEMPDAQLYLQSHGIAKDDSYYYFDFRILKPERSDIPGEIANLQMLGQILIKTGKNCELQSLEVYGYADLSDSLAAPQTRCTDYVLDAAQKILAPSKIILRFSELKYLGTVETVLGVTRFSIPATDWNGNERTIYIEAPGTRGRSCFIGNVTVQSPSPSQGS